MSNNPVTNVGGPDIRCNAGGARPAAAKCDVAAGGVVTVEMHQVRMPWRLYHYVSVLTLDENDSNPATDHAVVKPSVVLTMVPSQFISAKLLTHNLPTARHPGSRSTKTAGAQRVLSAMTTTGVLRT